MATTGTYILHKSTQLCTVVRTNVNFIEEQKFLDLPPFVKGKFQFPDGAASLPPRLHLSSLTSAVKLFCHKVRVKQQKRNLGWRSLLVSVSRKDFRRADVNEIDSFSCDCKCEAQNDNYMSCRDNLNNVTCEITSAFAWSLERITDQELVRCAQDFVTEKEHRRKESERYKESESRNEEWEKFLQQKQLQVWRRPRHSNGLYEYKVFGTFFDINADAFYKTQVDTEYRKSWDQYALNLDVIDKDQVSGSEVLHWVTQYPYPLKSRDYVYVRRSKVDHKSKTMVLVSKSTNHPSCPEEQEHVRVTDYRSEMVIAPHRNFTENGFDFVLTYFDDPKATIPSYCMNVITCSGIPDFIKTLYVAAKRHTGDR